MKTLLIYCAQIILKEELGGGLKHSRMSKVMIVRFDTCKSQVKTKT